MHRYCSGSLAAALLTVAAACVHAHGAAEETVTPRLQQALPNLPGKNFSVVSVDFAPGVEARPHRHGDAYVYAHVLTGTVRSQVEGERPRDYRTGEGWQELPGAHHVLTRNTSKTRPARLLVVFVSTAGDPLKVPDSD